MNEYDFAERLAWSRGQRSNTHMETIQSLIAGCASVEQTTPELDRKGIDYIARLRGGAALAIDIKERSKGVSDHWSKSPLFNQVEPELTLEYWSVMPYEDQPGVVGWTLDESKLTDYVLYTFDPVDTQEVFLLPFQLLRMAFRRNAVDWMTHFHPKTCTTNGGNGNGGWTTQSVFVPAWCVIEAVADQMRTNLSS